MTRRHKHAGASLAAETTLPMPRIAELCEDAARHAEGVQVMVRLEESKPGLLVYSVRNRLMGGRVEFMTFHLVVKDSDGRRSVKTLIRTYKQTRSRILLIPLPWQMLGWSSYKSFMQRLASLIAQNDPTSRTSIVEVEGGSGG